MLLAVLVAAATDPILARSAPPITVRVGSTASPARVPLQLEVAAMGATTTARHESPTPRLPAPARACTHPSPVATLSTYPNHLYLKPVFAILLIRLFIIKYPEY
ncbi:hypothetical protein WT25_16290 [Burkholderia territorii]|nr:hypothetical protein WT25_16290 [Burkholderia territorii]